MNVAYQRMSSLHKRIMASHSSQNPHARRYSTARKKDLPDEGGPDQDRKTSLALACIAATKPDISAEDACKLINKGFIAEHPDCYADLEVDEDILSDVVDKGEAKKMAEYTVELEKTKAKKSVVMQTREKCVGLYFKHKVAVKYTATSLVAVAR